MSERNELERLQHDIERHVSIAAEQATELARLRAEVERLTDERTRATAALREAFGEELWRLGHPAYVVVHLRDEIEKVTRLWKAAETKRCTVPTDRSAVIDGLRHLPVVTASFRRAAADMLESDGAEIERLRAEVARLTAEYTALNATHQALASDVQKWIGRHDALLKDNDALRARCDVAKRGLDAVEALMAESRGVAGLHLNGDEAPWDTLRTGGPFEEWLRDFDDTIVAQLEKEGLT